MNKNNDIQQEQEQADQEESSKIKKVRGPKI